MMHARHVPRSPHWLPWLILGVVMLSATLARAADTIVIDLGGTPKVTPIGPGMKSAVTRLLADENAQRTAQGQLTISAEEFLTQHLVNILQSKVEDAKVRNRQDACARFSALTAPQQATVIARPEWGGASPCS